MSAKNVKIYTRPEHYTPSARPELIDVLRPFIKNDHLTSDDLADLYGNWIKGFFLTDDITAADFAVLPMSWNYYYRQGALGQAIDFVTNAKTNGKKILTWTSGDFGARVPVEDVFVFRSSGYASQKHQGQITTPIFIDDPTKTYYGGARPLPRSKEGKPVIGFCGQADGRLGRKVLDLARIAYRNSRYYLGISAEEPQALISPTFRRAAALRLLENDLRISTNFIRRKKYRAGAVSEKEKATSSKIFFDNIQNSDYTLCVRGNGNFSARLYETMAMGRIPLFINTDTMMPLPDIIDWKKIVVWVEEKDMAKMPQILIDYHAGLTDSEFRERQAFCREVWEEYLSFAGFWAHALDDIIDENPGSENAPGQLLTKSGYTTN